MESKPIGIFDSGLGGLTVVKEIKRELPDENIVYLGDTARVPYGTRSKKTIINFSLQDAAFLALRDVKCIVIACHTSSANAFNKIKDNFSIPIFDIVNPGVTKAVNISKNGRVALIGTGATILSHAHKKKLNKLGIKKVYEKQCPLFVPFIEEGEIKGKIIEMLANKYLKDLSKKEPDTLILACTHYPIIRNIIKKEFKKNTHIVDPGKQLAKELKSYLKGNNMLNKKKKRDIYYLTDVTKNYKKTSNIFFGKAFKGKIVNIEL